MRARRVEVSQQRAVPLLKWLAVFLELVSLSVNVISDDQLDCALGSSIWVGGTDRAVFGNGNHVWYAGRISIDSRRGREDDIRDIVLGHRSQEGDGASDIHAIILEGDLGRFSNSLMGASQLMSAPLSNVQKYLERSKVNHTVDVGMCCKDLVDTLLVRDVNLVEVRASAAEQLYAI